MLRLQRTMPFVLAAGLAFLSLLLSPAVRSIFLRTHSESEIALHIDRLRTGSLHHLAQI